MSITMSTMRSQVRGGLVGTALMLFSVGCATQQAAQVPGSSTADLDKDVASVPGSASKSEPRIAEMTPSAAAKKGPTRNISDDAREDFDKAVARYEKLRKGGKLGAADCDDAAAGFRKAADANAQLMEARHNEASVYFECGKQAEAMALWERLATQNYAPALTNLGYLAWQKGNAAGAEDYFNRAVRADQLQGSVSARINLAQLLRDRGRRSGNTAEKNSLTQEAIGHLRRVLAIDGNKLQAYAILCYFYYDLGFLEMARLVGEQAIRRASEIATGKFEEQKGDTFGAAERGKKGKAAAKKDKDGDEPKAAKEKGGDESGTGVTAEMKKQLAVVYNTLGLMQLRRKNVAEAISNFRKSVDHDSGLNEARLNLAAVSLNFRDYKTAEENFREVLKGQPRNFEAVMGLGVALRGNRKFDEAEQQYLAAQKLDPANPDSYFNLGVLYQDYKGGEKPTLQRAQQFYRDYIGRAAGGGAKRKDAEKRIKDIDELFVALAEMAVMQKEADEIQRKSEEQQKKMEEELKKMQEAEKAQQASGKPAGPSAAGAPAPTAPGAPAAGAPPAAAPPPPPSTTKPPSPATPPPPVPTTTKPPSRKK